MQSFDLGQAIIKPNLPVVAGSFTTIAFTYTADHPIDDSGYLKIAFRSVSDVGAPQFDDPAQPNYCSIATTGDCSIEPRWDPRGHIRPWTRALFLQIRRGFLNDGEEITVIFGDSSGGSPGWQMQTSVNENFEFKTLVDPIATYQFKELPQSPKLAIIPGKPVRAVCVAPSQVVVNQEFGYHLKLEDRWGNPTKKPHFSTHSSFKETGVQIISATDASTGITATSNPIKVLPDHPKLHHYWADFHGQSGETVGERTIREYFTFARDYGFLDISAHQGNDFQVTDEFWEQINQTTREFYQPGQFVTFPGYEWSGNTPLGGDRNVYFEREGGQIARSSTELLPGNHSVFKDAPTATDLFKNLAAQRGPKAFSFAHVGGRYADISSHDPGIELAVEIHSAWGTFEWLLEDAFQKGYRVGVCANSDGHKCRPGASYPGASYFGSLGGLTCVLARGLDRENISAALQARQFYATTGNRPLLDIQLKTGDGLTAMMGTIVESSSAEATLDFRVVGTAPIESIEIRNGCEILQTLRPYPEQTASARLKIVWSGARVRGRDRVVRWDGNLKVRGNSILAATPINFWNANQPLEIINAQHLTWKSVTTGGLAGVILTLENPALGIIQIDTAQGQIECDISTVGITPQVWEYQGLEKKFSIYRLPESPNSNEFSFSLPITKLQPGDNPIFVKVTQEDGHLAWTSPIYLVI
jgi:hypothetical protein